MTETAIIFKLPVTKAGRQCLREALEVFQWSPPFEPLSHFDWDESAVYLDEMLAKHGGQK